MEDLLLARTVVLVLEFAVKDPPLDREIYDNNDGDDHECYVKGRISMICHIF